MQAITELNRENFDDAVAHSDKLTLVEFWKEECDPCRRMSLVLDEIADRYPGEIKMAKYQVDRDGNAGDEVADRYSVNIMPQLIAFNAGVVVGSIKGYRNLPELSVGINNLLRSSGGREG